MCTLFSLKNVQKKTITEFLKPIKYFIKSMSHLTEFFIIIQNGI